MTLTPPSKEQKHVLIIDDNPDWVESVEDRLNWIGEIIYDSTKGKIAKEGDRILIEKIASYDYKIIFVDNSVYTNLLEVNLNLLNFHDPRLEEVKQGSRFSQGEMLVMWMKTKGGKLLLHWNH